MSRLLVLDSQDLPDLFDFRLPASDEELDSLEHRLGVALPPSFREVLQDIGQGSFFDNETLLGVHEIDEGFGDLESVNRELHEKQGLPETLIVFHIGIGGMHAFDTASTPPEYEVVEINEDTLERGEVWSDLDEWYEARMRTEYASVLGLN